MQLLKILFCIIGRMLLSSIFIIAGINKCLNFSSAKEGYLEILGKWHMVTDNTFLEKLFNLMAEQANLFLGTATALELVGGGLIFIGIFARIGAWCLIFFLIPVTLVFHPFWILQSPEKDLQLVMFMKNLSILGGMLMVAVFGSGISFKKKEDLS
jgi:uncharacterized membrane protein YphA (DoxX/SURF4 family)